MQPDISSETLLNEIDNIFNLHNEDIETVSAQTIKIINTDVSINCVLQGL